MRPWLHPLDSPTGPLELAAEAGGALVYLGFNRPEQRSRLPRYLEQGGDGLARDPAVLEPVRRQLEAYFRRELREFQVPLALRGTPFQLRVWAELQRIPYGTTISYLELARRLGDPKATRAVGTANGANPISIIVPCHRVIGANGSLTGYGGGLDNKQRLLELEGWVRQGRLFDEAFA
ncbi:MAG: methylated-DNA--[protein]-cysteine S-methyltransferase [Holophaga sp.]|jgi:methylated-DNA-[protein]-cysteine S-methyltransferase